MSSIEQRDSTRLGTVWRVRFRHDGRNRAVTFATLGHAQDWQRKLDAIGPARALADLEDPDATPGERTLAEQIAHHIDHLTGVEDGTRSDYRTYLRRDIAPLIGNVPLSLLRADDVATWVNALAARGLAAKTIRNRHSLISSALQSAVRDGLVKGNVAEGVRMPRKDHNAVEMVTLTLEELWQLVGIVDPFWRPLVLLLAGTGVRFGEATALRVGDVDLGTMTARIRQAWKHTDGHGHKLGPPKSKRSVRTVVFGRDVAAALAPLMEGQPASAFVIRNRRGGPVRRSNFHGDVWTPAVRQFAGDTSETIPTGGRPRKVWTPGPGKRPRPHDLRHTYASLQIQRGRSMEFLQVQMGHESIVTTIGTYTHLRTADLHVLADVIERPALELGR